MENRLIRHGFILILLSLFTGFAILAAEAPRLAMSAHTIGLMSGILLLAIAGIWSRLALSEGQLKVTYWGWIYASYANWLGILPFIEYSKARNSSFFGVVHQCVLKRDLFYRRASARWSWYF